MTGADRSRDGRYWSGSRPVEAGPDRKRPGHPGPGPDPAQDPPDDRPVAARGAGDVVDIGRAAPGGVRTVLRPASCRPSWRSSAATGRCRRCCAGRRRRSTRTSAAARSWWRSAVGRRPGQGGIQGVRPQVVAVHTCFVSADVAEVSAHVRYGRRSRAVAARFERRRDRWVCCALEFA